MPKPGEHPDFFRFPAPEGRSRESTIRVDAHGVWTHDGDPVTHERLRRALASWVRRHPDDGRYILSNGYDWTYFTVDDVPLFVESVTEHGLILHLSDGSEEPWDLAHSTLGANDAVYTQVKRTMEGGPIDARFSRHAQNALASLLETDPDGDVGVRVDGQFRRIGA